MTELNQSFVANSPISASEALFQFSELLYSRTDKRGIVQASNSVFQRVSGFEWDEFLNAPHKIVRHEDMPKGVFYLLWERLKAGKLTGAYVKNQRKGGRYYWVFALLSPTEDGYISVRMKPSSDLFPKVMQAYEQLLKQEKSEPLTPEKSAEVLRKAVKELGYSSYEAFQSHAIALEYTHRARHRGHNVEQLQRRFMEMSRAIGEVQIETTEMTEAFKAIRTVPMNMRIIASRLENAGGPISAISVNYSQMLEEMSTWVDTFVDGEACVFARIRNAILKGQLLSFGIALEKEMADIFTNDTGEYPESVCRDDEIKHLGGHGRQFVEDMSKALDNVETEAKRFSRSVLDMKRYVTGLSSTRMMCKIESAALSNSGTALSGIVEQLDACQNEIEQRLAKVVELNSVIQGNTAMLRAL